MENMVYIKYLGPEGQYFRHVVLHHPWHFDPICAMPFSEYDLNRAYFDQLSEYFEVVTEAEYIAEEKAKAEKEAAVFYCGDFGGVNGKGVFCGRRVPETGCRCEHHGGKTPEQGSFEYAGGERPKGLGFFVNHFVAGAHEEADPAPEPVVLHATDYHALGLPVPVNEEISEEPAPDEEDDSLVETSEEEV